METKGMAAQPGNRCRHTSKNDTEIIASSALGLFGALLFVGVPLLMALLKQWGCW